MTDLRALLEALVDHHVEFVVIGGVALVILSLDTLERAKRAAGRRHDLLDLAEIVEIRRRRPPE